MKNIILLLFIFYSISLNIKSQSQWQRTIGGMNNEEARCIIQTSDGGYILSGYTISYSAGNEDIYLVKLSSSGLIQWTKTIGGTEVDIARSIIQTTDGGYAIAGDTYNIGNATADFLILKTDAAGTIQWIKSFNRAAYDYATSIVQTSDGGYAIGGMSATGGVFSGDMFNIKINSSGTNQWSNTYGGSHDEVTYCIIKTTDGGLAFAGYSNSFGPYNLFNFIKTDSLGNIQWNRLIGESGTGSHIYSIMQTTDGGYVLAGELTLTGSGNYEMYIVKLNSAGNIQWTRYIGGSGNDNAFSLAQTTDGNFVLGGYTNSFGAGNYDMYFAKINGSGLLLWSKTVGGPGEEQALSIIKTTDGGFLAAGYTTSFGSGGKDMFIVKFDSAGNTCGNTTSPTSTTGTSGTATNPTFTVVSQNPTVFTPTPTIGSGGILNTICSTSPPLPPNLLSPPNNSFNQLSSIRFIWNKSIGAQTYRLQVSQDSIFTNMVVNDSTLTDSTILVTNLITNKYYWWRVNAKNAIGTSSYSAIWKLGTFFVGLNQISAEIPKEFKLYNNYPNPFNPVTKIRFNIPLSRGVDAAGGRGVSTKFNIYDILGKEIYTLNESNLNPGTYEYQFDGSNSPSGLYFYRLISGNFSETKKMVLIK